ncbi:cyclic pyranopterin phosphate synthase [Inhella inkyongensis]|uniref:GTP 3',8-cyclase n=1 Tax=Inhella inkyongensis TaxID=392593 RepID=A0A840S8Y1_9BURK|nr:GTP 3',8-cyclase MoaA [Inhella inkyongensis]MBB5204991.1 cyclic pyranopterin phosphate synthase [Inhella inkyongensis]
MRQSVVPMLWIPAPRAAGGSAAHADAAATTPLRDRRQRAWRDLRISLTDRCNFRCDYCMPRSRFGPGHRFLPQARLLSFEEISQVAQQALQLGVRTLRLTGGEPLLRRDLPLLVRQLAALRTPEGEAPDLALTTNGSLLAEQAAVLRAAGLQRLTVSLDALDAALFARMNGVGFAVTQVLRGLEAAQAAGFERIKINMVVRRGVNDAEALPLAAHFRASGMVLRFIEFMDTGCDSAWRPDEVLPSAELRARLAARWPLRPLAASRGGETAERWAYADGAGEVGFISSVSQAFCGDCTRARLTADGRLFTCLFGSQGHDLRPLLRGTTGHPAALRETLASIWRQRGDAYSEQREQLRGQALHARAEMHELGG